jgi:hypothetical protein
MELRLATTRGKLREANDDFLDILDVFRIINLPSPRSWQATIAFDVSGDNLLHIGASPALTDADIQQLLDGRVPSLFAFKGLVFRIGGKVLKVALEPETWDAERETFLPAYEDFGESVNGQLKIIGYALPPSLCVYDTFLEWLHSNTWFGSQKFRGKNYALELTYMSIRTTFQTRKRSLSPSVPVFEQSVPLNVNDTFSGHLYIKLQPDGPRTIRHLKFGIFDPEAIRSQFWRRLKLRDNGVELEIDEPHLSWFTSIGSLDFHYQKELLASVLAQRAEIAQMPKYVDFQNAINLLENQVAAQKLLERQQRLQRSPKIVCKAGEIMAVPSCENELVALYMKLETLGMIPFACKVLEYTSRAGIDALANHRIAPAGAFSLYAPVEFEYSLENYFDHEHPMDQTTLIICWEANEDVCSDRCRSTPDRWLYFAIGANVDIPVLVLSKIPELEITLDNHN